jgi:hypothetical protein
LENKNKCSKRLERRLLCGFVCLNIKHGPETGFMSQGKFLQNVGKGKTEVKKQLIATRFGDPIEQKYDICTSRKDECSAKTEQIKQKTTAKRPTCGQQHGHNENWPQF